jgi:type IV secretion system protein VirB9
MTLAFGSVIRYKQPMANMTRPALVAGTLALAACATQPPEVSSTPPAVSAPAPDPRREYTMDDLVVPRTPVDAPAAPARPEARVTDAQANGAVAAANRESLVLPTLGCFSGKACEHWYLPDEHYAVLMAVGNQTLTCLWPGERTRDIAAPGGQVLVPHRPYTYGSGKETVQCIAWMPRRAGLRQSVTVFTNMRKVDLQVRTYRQGGPHHVEVRWRDPEAYLAALNDHPAPGRLGPDDRDPTTDMPFRDRNCAYAVEGDSPDWRPVPTVDGQPPVCDDGEVTVVNFTPGVLGVGAPTPWRITEDGTRMPIQFEAVNSTYRIAGVHDHLVLGIGAQEVHVRRKPRHGR